MLLDLVDNSVNTFRHVVRALASRTPGPPYTEVSVLLFDLGGCEAFIVSVVPFSAEGRNDMVRKLRKRIEEEVKRFMRTLAR